MTEKTFSLLIVDDDFADRKHIVRSVKAADLLCDITQAEHLEEALEFCEKQEFDCIILDYNLPGVNGLEGVAMLHERFPHSSIIMSTGQGDEVPASEAIKQGAMDYIPKRTVNSDVIERVLNNTREKAALVKKVAEQREALKNFAYILGHDLLAPIRHMRAYVDMMTVYIEKGNYDKVKEFCKQTNQQGDYVQKLVETLQEYNKLESDSVTFENVQMNEVVEQAIKNLSLIIEDAGAQVTHDALPEMKGNEPQLVQLLQNLIGNGIKYCTEEVPKVHIGTEERQGKHYIYVQDNGIGIEEKFFDKIFEPFRRLHASDEFSGTGLGLATCIKIIERHRGEIKLDSEAGKGSKFYFTLGKE